MLKLFQPSYLFSTNPGTYFQFFWPLLILFVLLFVFSVWADKRIKKSENKVALRKTIPGFGTQLRISSFIGVMLLLVRAQGIPFFSMRFFMVVLLAYIVVYLLISLRRLKVKLPKVKAQLQHHLASSKYLPRKKKKKKKKR